MTAIAMQYREQILESVAQGKRLSDILQSLNVSVSRQAISKVLQKDTEYQEARTFGLLTILDQREEQMERAVEQVDVARARELLAQARWRAERERPQIWGQRTQIDVTVNIGDTLQALAERRAARLGVSVGVSGATIEHDANTINDIESDSVPCIGITSDADDGQDAKSTG